MGRPPWVPPSFVAGTHLDQRESTPMTLLLAASDQDWIAALVTMGVAVAIAFAIDRLVIARGTRMASRVSDSSLSRGAQTRLRLVRRLVFLVILAIGAALALSKFTQFSRLATGILASSAVLGLVVGFAARQTLANLVAGILLAITQPIRVGDWVRFEDHYGVVVDVRLNYTILRTAGETRLVIPNERLAAGILQNDTLVDDEIALEVTLWIPPDADAGRAQAILQEESGGSATVAEMTPDGVRLAVSGAKVTAPERAAGEADLRARCHARLRADGLLEGFTGSDRS